MDQVILFKVALSFLAGGGVVTLITYLSEKLGSTVGGILAGMPSTISMSLLFVGVVGGAQAAVDAVPATIVALSLFGIFCMLYRHLAPRGFWFAVISALIGWFLAALPIVWLDVKDFKLALMLFTFVALPSFYILNLRGSVLLTEKNEKIRAGWGKILRFFMGGGIVALAVIMSVIGGEVLGGIFAAFPAMALSTLIILNVALGTEFTTRFIKTMFVSSQTNCLIYLLCVYIFYPAAGLWAGTALSYAAVVVSGTVLYKKSKGKGTA